MDKLVGGGGWRNEGAFGMVISQRAWMHGSKWKSDRTEQDVLIKIQRGDIDARALYFVVGPKILLQRLCSRESRTRDATFLRPGKISHI